MTSEQHRDAHQWATRIHSLPEGRTTDDSRAAAAYILDNLPTPDVSVYHELRTLARSCSGNVKDNLNLMAEHAKEVEDERNKYKAAAQEATRLARQQADSWKKVYNHPAMKDARDSKAPTETAVLAALDGLNTIAANSGGRHGRWATPTQMLAIGGITPEKAFTTAADQFANELESLADQVEIQGEQVKRRALINARTDAHKTARAVLDHAEPTN